MSYLLHIETSTTVCSVALSNNNDVIECFETNDGYTHAENLAVFIEKAITDSKIKYSDLSAISISKGPGSYTGLRIGTATAKGLCYALNIPLIAIETLESMAINAAKQIVDKEALYCPMIDARRMEVYTSLYDFTENVIEQTKALIIDSNRFSDYLSNKKIYFFGNGAEKCKTTITNENAVFLDNINPSAKNLVDLAYTKFKNRDFEDVAYFEPYYLKDFIATTPKKLI